MRKEGKNKRKMDLQQFVLSEELLFSNNFKKCALRAIMKAFQDGDRMTTLYCNSLKNFDCPLAT